MAEVPGNGIPFSNDPKVHDKIGNIKTDPKDLADSSHHHGVEFLKAARFILKCMPEYGDVIGTNLAFACELFLKSMLHSQRIKFKKEHNLENLYRLLPNVQKEEIRLRVKDVPLRKNEDFELILSEISHAFVFQRYIYERKGAVADIGSLLGLACVLCSMIECPER